MSELIENIVLTTDIQQLISIDQAWYFYIIPKETNNDSITFFIDESKNTFDIKEEMEVVFNKTIILEPVASAIMKKALGKYYRGNISKKQQVKDVNSGNTDDFIIKLIQEAIQVESSDIHIERYKEKCRVRMRIDGNLVERYILKENEYPTIINKIKIKANLDIAEKRLPQDGRLFYDLAEDQIDLRVSILPTLFGEKVVMRLLSKDATNIELSKLGFTDVQLNNYLHGIKKTHGIILISGPTGSGKTTTLYATLKILNKEKTNIITIEDPIEYTLEGINQVQLKESIGLSFASALRTFLRQDPDIVMLGEIRDSETAKMAVRAALTGHLVLSTIHTNSAWGTVSRLLDMGVPAYLLANTIRLSGAQRLVRLLCPKCKTEKEMDSALFPPEFQPYWKINSHFLPNGCEHCFYTGYRGRKAVYEVITMDYELADHIKKSSINIQDVLKEKGIKSLSHSAYEMLDSGETSLEEVYSILTDY